jgi:hypothetical protein
MPQSLLVAQKQILGLGSRQSRNEPLGLFASHDGGVLMPGRLDGVALQKLVEIHGCRW